MTTAPRRTSRCAAPKISTGSSDGWREQKARPLTDALIEHGLLPGDPAPNPCMAAFIVPDWWPEIPEPHDQCMWCQRPGMPSPCGECTAARAADADPPPVWAFWAGCTPAQRRFHIAARFGTDPWSGRRCTIRQEQTEMNAEGEIRTERLPYFGAAPDGIYWGAQRRG